MRSLGNNLSKSSRYDARLFIFPPKKEKKESLRIELGRRKIHLVIDTMNKLSLDFQKCANSTMKKNPQSTQKIRISRTY